MKKLSIIPCLLVTFFTQAIELSEDEIHTIHNYLYRMVSMHIDETTKSKAEAVSNKVEFRKEIKKLYTKESIDKVCNNSDIKGEQIHFLKGLSDIAINYWFIRRKINIYQNCLQDNDLSDSEREKIEKYIIRLKTIITTIDVNIIDKLSALGVRIVGTLGAEVSEQVRKDLSAEDPEFGELSMLDQNIRAADFMEQLAKSSRE